MEEEEYQPTIEEVKHIVDTKRKTKKQVEIKELPELKSLIRKEKKPKARAIKQVIEEPIEEPIKEPIKELINDDTKLRELQDDVYNLTNLIIDMMKSKPKIKPKTKPKPRPVTKTLDLTISDKEIVNIINDNNDNDNKNKPTEKPVKGSSNDDKLKAFLDAMTKK